MLFTLRDAIDILIVAYVIHRVIQSIQGTRATTLVKGLAVIFVSSVVARALSLRTVSWLLEQATTLVLVALPVVFYPELRRGLEQLGRGQLFNWGQNRNGAEDSVNIESLNQAMVYLSERKIGALVVIERQVGLDEFIETGIPLDARPSKELLISIFEPSSPLHDGAVIIRGDRLASAASVLPLTDSRLSGNLGTRHRAAVGMSEQTDAIIIVVSEETGTISLAVGGSLRRYLTEARLKEQLNFHWRGGQSS